MRNGRVDRRVVGLAAAALAAVAISRAMRKRSAYTFRDKSVLITGGSRGLGLVLARQLASQGARLTLLARDESELQRAAADLRRRHSAVEVLLVPADVRERQEVERSVAQAIAHYGRIDVVVNNAGIIEVGPFDHMGLNDYENAMRTHFWGPLFMTLAVVPHMRAHGGGRIVNVSSVGGRVSVPHLLPYSASKFALCGLSDGLRAELARDQIVVTTVCPGLMRTGSAVNAQFKGQQSQEYSWFATASFLPGLTVDAERAARQILEACRQGRAELIVGVQARLGVLARAIAPETVARTLALVDRLLPAAVGPSGDIAQVGRAAGPDVAVSAVLAPMYSAAQRNNEL